MRYQLYILLFFVSFVSASFACTTAVITGRATVDGRPLLYKHRDTGSLDNKVMLFSDGKYKYVGIVNSKDIDGREVWSGHNTTGFAIMNSASYNLNPEAEDGKPELEGVVMKLALQKCATLQDFENLLDTLPKPMNLSANFGVIDAHGGAAYYETGDFGYKKFDANETTEGYLIRTNFSYSGDRERDLGLSRCEVATCLFQEEAEKNNLSFITIFKDISRSLKHGIMDIDLYDQQPVDSTKPHFVSFRDFVPRYSTSSSTVVQGVSKDNSPTLTTMWTMLGFPLTAVAIPILITPDGTLPEIVLANESGNAPLCDWSLELKKRLFPITRGEGKDYLDLSKLITHENDGLLQQTKLWEDEVYNFSKKYLNEWYVSGKIGENYHELYRKIDEYLSERYKSLSY